jgi:transcriptional regulator with XRE-family HTH domain
MDDLDKETLAKNLQAARRLSGLTQQQAADLIKTPAPSISDWERGARSPTIFTLVLLADAYGVSLDKLVRGAETKGPSTGPTAEEISALKTLLRSARKSLSDAASAHVDPLAEASTAKALTSIEAAEILID